MTPFVAEIKALPSENIVFLKKINLENTYSSDVVCYARKLSDTYTIVPQKDRQKALMFGYDENEYPCDELDSEILACIRQRFPNAECHTCLIMFDAEVTNQKRLAQSLKLEKNGLLVEFSPTSLPITVTPIVEYKEVYVLHNPYNEGKKRLNSHIQLITSNADYHHHLCQLLKDTYVSYVEVLAYVQ